MDNMRKMFLTLLFLVLITPINVYAQNSTGSASTSSATATNSASTSSATATPTATATPAATATLPATGAHDVLVLGLAGIIFLVASITTFSGTKEVFNDFE